MKKIALITLYQEENIGNKLQNYAMVQIVMNNDFLCETIKYRKKYIGWKGRMIVFLGIPKRKAAEKRKYWKRIQKFKRFSRKYLHTRDIVSIQNPKKLRIEKYDLFIVGSDQVWHNWNDSAEEINYFMLRFVPRNKRACFSPSFGRESIPSRFAEEYSRGLNGFPYLSCREKSGCELIYRLTGRQAELLVDPTLMLSIQEWNEIAKKPKVKFPERFILTYFLGEKTKNAQKYINKISEEENWEIVDIYNTNEPQYYDISPDEFLYLIQKAAYVCTDSFHGSVFSIIYHKQFAVFDRVDNVNNEMQNRIVTLLMLFQLVENYNPIERKKVQYSNVDKIIGNQREKATRYLKRIFDNIS